MPFRSVDGKAVNERKARAPGRAWNNLEKGASACSGAKAERAKRAEQCRASRASGNRPPKKRHTARRAEVNIYICMYG